MSDPTDENVAIIGNPVLLQRGEPLIQALRSVRVAGVLASTVAIGSGSWSASIPVPDECALLYVVARGRCVGGTFDPATMVDLSAGDILLFPHPGRYILSERRGIAPVPLEDMLEEVLGGIEGVEGRWKSLFSSPFTIAGAEAGDPVVAITALRLFFDHGLPAVLLRGLPPFVHLPGFATRHGPFVETDSPAGHPAGGRGFRGGGGDPACARRRCSSNTCPPSSPTSPTSGRASGAACAIRSSPRRSAPSSRGPTSTGRWRRCRARPACRARPSPIASARRWR
ncbi:cupin domain-containing protein [Rhizorhabdus wittichii]|uniref:Cupin domain-containing protein n=1 Tax=Rhizorhabdus wittichii TaxID=160791 RepID=A0A975HEX6_9SPHN|nr:cupin domain-containing protein [Rhizorhabdus wittichii]